MFVRNYVPRKMTSRKRLHPEEEDEDLDYPTLYKYADDRLCYSDDEEDDATPPPRKKVVEP